MKNGRISYERLNFKQIVNISMDPNDALNCRVFLKEKDFFEQSVLQQKVKIIIESSIQPTVSKFHNFVQWLTDKNETDQ
jgi:hypothetical protein